ncbi:MAG: AI-2E family transporter [Treponema sp.]|jgi:predicted PurR-regulated permease PerM|nr:AI-2E family transporter [Treponema sp.]
MKEQPSLTPPHWPVQSYVFGAILIFLFVMVCRLLAPFFTALLWSTLLYIMFSPLHRRLVRDLNFNTIKGKILRNLWAVIFTLGTMVLILIPLSLVISIFFKQILELGRYGHEILNQRPEYLRDIFEKVSELINDVSAGMVSVTADSIELQAKTAISNQMQRAVYLSSNIAKNIGSFSLTMLLIMFSLFFFYIDGSYLSRLVLRAIPIKKEYISALTSKFIDITRNLFFGYIIVALLQSTVAFGIYTLFGVKGSLVLSVLTFIIVFIPMFGATLIYIPVTILKIASGDVAGGVLFLIVSIIFISGIDNILRPFFLRDRIHLHPLIIFFAIMGGLFVFGFNGFILGPVLVILFLTVLDLFLTEHKIGHQE